MEKSVEDEERVPKKKKKEKKKKKKAKKVSLSPSPPVVPASVAALVASKPSPDVLEKESIKLSEAFNSREDLDDLHAPSKEEVDGGEKPSSISGSHPFSRYGKRAAQIDNSFTNLANSNPKSNPMRKEIKMGVYLLLEVQNVNMTPEAIAQRSKTWRNGLASAMESADGGALENKVNMGEQPRLKTEGGGILNYATDEHAKLQTKEMKEQHNMMHRKKCGCLRVVDQSVARYVAHEIKGEQSKVTLPTMHMLDACPVIFSCPKRKKSEYNGNVSRMCDILQISRG